MNEMQENGQSVVRVTVALALTLVVAACLAPRALDYDAFASALRDAGADVEVVDEELAQPFISAPGRLIRIDGHDVQIFGYAEEADAASEAALISPDGTSVGTSTMSWIATPHFYQKGQIIAIYVGDDAGVRDRLEQTLGPQIAGG